MSALGEYVHLYYKNYKKYGVTKKDPDGKGVPNYSMDVINRRIKDNTSKVKKGTLTILEKRLKANSSSKKNKATKDWKIQQQKLIDEIYSLLYERVSNVKGVTRLREVAAGGAWSTEKETGKRIQLSTSQNWASSLSHQELMTRHYQAQSIDKKIQSLINQINKEKQPQSEQNLQALIRLYEQYTHLSEDSLENPTIERIQEAIKEKRYQNMANAIGGKFGEMLVAICDDTARNLAEGQVAKFLENTLKGQQKTYIAFDKDLLITREKEGRTQFLNTSSKDGTKYTLGSTQNKVDVQISIQDEEILASVKTSVTREGFSARPDLQDINLFSTLVFLNNYESYVDFGNHWLNMHALNPDEEKRYRPGKKKLDEIVKKEVAFEAFSSGNPLKQGVKSANVFVFINRETGNVYVKNIQDILKNNMNQIGGLDNISNIYLENRKQTRIYDRIYNILNQLHQQKISVAYNIPTSFFS